MSPEQDFKGRVRDERDQLKHKIERLEAFIGSPVWEGLTDAERVRLRLQFGHQHLYLACLDARIAADFQ